MRLTLIFLHFTDKTNSEILIVLPKITQQTQDLNPGCLTPNLMFVKWMNNWFRSILIRHAQSRITPLVWTSFSRRNGGPTYLLGHSPWLSFTILDSDEEGMVSIPRVLFLQKMHDYVWKLQTSLTWLITPTGSLATQTRMVIEPLAHLHFYNTGAKPAYIVSHL